MTTLGTATLGYQASRLCLPLNALFLLNIFCWRLNENENEEDHKPIELK